MATKTQAAIVHYPGTRGPICGNLDKRGRIKRPIPTDARSYSVEPARVTCELCLEYLQGVGGHLHTAGLQGEMPERETSPAAAPSRRSPRE